VKVGRLLLEGCVDCFRGKVVEVEQESVGIDRFDADWFARRGRRDPLVGDS
jgi:hypothetical protein